MTSADKVQMEDAKIAKKMLAIVQFGPASTTSGFRAAEYYQVTIDPNMVSPSGEFIRFGLYPNDEIQGWQRVAAMTIAEVLGEQDAPLLNKPTGYTEVRGAVVAMRCIADNSPG